MLYFRHDEQLPSHSDPAAPHSGHGGIVTTGEQLNLANWLDTFQAGDPYAGSCNSCHGQPPVTGAHEVHTALAKIGTDCAVCHNGAIDLSFPATWNTKSGSAGGNGSTCSTIRCHGDQTTPDRTSGTLNSGTQCKSCHAYGTAQYNGYSSGMHKKHAVDKRYDCQVSGVPRRGQARQRPLQRPEHHLLRAVAGHNHQELPQLLGRYLRTTGCHGSKSWQPNYRTIVCPTKGAGPQGPTPFSLHPRLDT